jgi:hypothetical protein
MRQRQAAQGFVAMAVFGGSGFQEFASRRGVEEQITRLDHRAATQRRRLRHPHHAIQRADLPGMRQGFDATGQLDPRNRRDAGQRLAAKTQAGDAFEFVQAENLAGGMPGQRQRQFFRRDAAAVVGDPDQLDAAFLQIDANLGRTRIQTVFQQLLQRRRRPLDHLAGGDLRDQQVG